ncbi:MAG: DUF3596 domain-containing protein [Mariprofundaceae bacterium]
MASIRSRSAEENLFFDFIYMGKRCREQTKLSDNPANRRKLQKILDKIQAGITLGTFNYASFFPNSSNLAKFQQQQDRIDCRSQLPSFKEFSESWYEEMKIQWRRTHKEGVQDILDQYLLDWFGSKEVSCITKTDVLAFRTSLGKVNKRSGKQLSASRINHIMTPLRMILNEAANRFQFSSPYHGIKSLKVPRTDVEPFTLDEVMLILRSVRPDFKNYFTVRFFTAIRTSEIDGLQWQYVDFERRQILIRQALVLDELVYTKNDGSYRAIDMSEMVYVALKEQLEATGKNDFVFCNTKGGTLSHRNITKRVWHPLLKFLGLRARRPYQTRHTAATLWLAAGESPEWIARQMGHTTSEMLFRTYSRYIPNLTRQDGSAFERLLAQHQAKESKDV